MKNEKETKPASDGTHDIFGKHVAGKIKGYENFNHKETKYLSALEFSWAVDGCEQFNKFLPMTIGIISEQMDFARHMTKRSFAHYDENVDTEEFRNAIVFYL